MVLVFITILEALAGLRAILRMLATAGGAPLARGVQIAPATLAAIVPVLDEERRLGALLAALGRCGTELGEIVVVDGGSTDGTRAVARAAAERDPRVRFIDAAPVPPGWNGKAWNL
jgi:dolichol-phosphate mannosyltransferase